jgi:hypothetical protein
MQLPEIGSRIRAGALAEVTHIDPPNAIGNVRCIVEDGRGRLGWIMYYPGGTRSNINFFREDRVEAVRASLAQPEDELRQGG